MLGIARTLGMQLTKEEVADLIVEVDANCSGGPLATPRWCSA
jgi:Ca2+-binding EF-hand superfamily protein